MQTLNEVELVALARCGERRAFEQLVLPYLGRLRRHVRRLVSSDTDADDVMQETLLGAWLGLPTFQGRSSLYTWLYRVSHNTALNFLKMARRREARVTSHVALDDGPDGLEDGIDGCEHDTPEALLEARQRLSGLIAGLRALDAERREAFIQTSYHGASYRHVASRFGVPVGTIRSRIHRARSDLGLLEHSAKRPRAAAVRADASRR